MELDQDTRASLQALVDARCALIHAPSIVCGVVRDGAVLATFASGSVDDATPTEHTAYRIASMTKSFTAAAVLLLRDDGALALDDLVARHLPEFAHLRGPTADAPAPRVRDLLTMSSGLATDDPWADRHMDCTDDDIDAWLSPGALFAWPTGTAYEYSNLGYALLGRIVERASGQRLQSVVRTRLLEPLGLTRTSWTAPERDFARPFRAVDGVIADEGSPLVGDGALAPLGGLWSSLTDIARWSHFFANAFPARDAPEDAPLCRASRREMQQMTRYAGTSHTAARVATTGYGYGLNVRDDPVLGTVVSHSGGLPGYGSNMRWIVGDATRHGVGVVAFANRTYAPMARLTLDVLDVLNERGALGEKRSPDAGPRLAELAARLVNLLAHWNDDDAYALFADNVALDTPFPRRRADALAMLARLGGTPRIERVTAEGAACGVVHLVGDSDRIEIEFDLAPLLPARIQAYDWEGLSG